VPRSTRRDVEKGSRRPWAADVTGSSRAVPWRVTAEARPGQGIHAAVTLQLRLDALESPEVAATIHANSLAVLRTTDAGGWPGSQVHPGVGVQEEAHSWVVCRAL